MLIYSDAENPCSLCYYCSCASVLFSNSTLLLTHAYTDVAAEHEVDEIDLAAVVQLLSDANPVFQRCKSHAEVAVLAQRARALNELMSKLTTHTAAQDAGRLKYYFTTYQKEVMLNITH
jgi:cell division protein FtsB